MLFGGGEEGFEASLSTVVCGQAWPAGIELWEVEPLPR